ncbi:glycosyltransferase [Pedobacter montanisoli]|uniref:Glycosyltransferase n=1 Tax=Pedobacter montanisoli TaxID=2923277 RepID=A0ABS9ZX71_9SPHI|nr:glycosyltransferase [Pedobacter montanisoli]MCJ0742903.1 glycosyltransferase [Pedobacter montanisoli]
MELNLIEFTLLIALVICLLIQLYYTLFVHVKLARYKIAEIDAEQREPISIIVCARNEAENLRENLPKLLSQNYDQFQVVVVNDRSWDGTKELLEEFSKQYANLKVVTVSEGGSFIAGKKFAATMGIKAAQYNWLVFTDADCVPASENWLSGMQKPVNRDIEIVLGYSPYTKKRSLLNVLIRFETFFTAVNYLSFALKGMPYMGVGRNMAYRKELFFRNKGFAAHMHVPSGDDDLFVNANATADNTIVQINRETHVWSEPKQTFLSYIRQKKRHIGAGKLYKPKHKFILSLQIVTQFLFYALFVALLCFKATQLIALGVLVLNIIIRSFVYPKLLYRLNYKELRWWFPFLDVLLVLFLVFNAILSIFVKKVSWK